MNRVVQRILNTFSILRGPFQKQGTLELHVDVRSPERAHLKLQHLNHQLHLDLPKGARLRKATLTGWRTVWDGSQATLEGESFEGQTLQLAIPAHGWWNVSTKTTSVDLFHLQRSSEESLSFRTFLRKFLGTLHGTSLGTSLGTYFKEGFQTPALTNLAVAVAVHALLLLGALNLNLLKERLPFLRDTQPQTITKAEPTQVRVQLEKSQSEFNGRGLFSAVEKHAEKNFKAKDVVQGLKGLKGLAKSLNQTSPSQLVVSEGVPDGGASKILSDSLKSIQAGISKQSGSPRGSSSSPGPGSASEGALQVHWKSQFLTDSGKASHKLNDGQLKILQELFARLQDQFRGCYEAALSQFEEMSVTVSFQAEITHEGRIGSQRYSVSGRSTPDSQATLLACLGNVMDQAEVDAKLSGLRIKNQFIFKS